MLLTLKKNNYHFIILKFIKATYFLNYLNLSNKTNNLKAFTNSFIYLVLIISQYVTIIITNLRPIQVSQDIYLFINLNIQMIVLKRHNINFHLKYNILIKFCHFWLGKY
jgi:hypothetical protein